MSKFFSPKEGPIEKKLRLLNWQYLEVKDKDIKTKEAQNGWQEYLVAYKDEFGVRARQAEHEEARKRWQADGFLVPASARTPYRFGLKAIETVLEKLGKDKLKEGSNDYEIAMACKDVTKSADLLHTHLFICRYVQYLMDDEEPDPKVLKRDAKGLFDSLYSK